MGEKGLSLPHFVTLLLLSLKISDSVIEARRPRRPPPPPQINVLHLNEIENTVADSSVKLFYQAVSQLSQLRATKIVLTTVSGNRTDGNKFLDNICDTYDAMLRKKNPPHLVVDTTTTGEASEGVKALTRALALPTVSASFGQRFWRDLDAVKNQYLIQVSPPADTIAEIVPLLITKQNSLSSAVLFDQGFAMDYKYKSLLENVFTHHVIAQINQTNITAQINELTRSNIKNYFLLARVSTIEKILKVANKLDLYKSKYAWYAITQSNSNVGYISESATYIFIKPIIKNTLLNHIPKQILDFLMKNELQVASVFYFELMYQSVIAARNMILEGEWKKNMKYIKCSKFNKKRSLTRVDLNLRKYFSTSSNNELLNITQNGESRMNFEMQLIGLQRNLGKYQDIGIWNASNGNLTISSKDMKSYAAKTVYQIVTVIQEPFIIQNDRAGKRFSGYCIDILNDIARALKFDYELRVAKGNRFGYMDDNGTWNGVVKELVDKTADIGLGAMSVMSEREKVIDFTIPYYDFVGIRILMKVHVPSTSFFKFLTVIESEVWLTILLGYFFTGILTYIFDRWSPYSYTNRSWKYRYDFDKREFNLLECFWFCITSLTPQGGGDAPKNISGRLVAAVWWLFAFVIFASYSAYLAAFLTVSRLETPINSMDDLSQQYKLEYAPLNDSMTMRYFKRMADIEAHFYDMWTNMTLKNSLSVVNRSKLSVWEYPVSDKYTKIWNAMIKAGLPHTLKEAVARVRASKSTTEGFAFIEDVTNIRYLEMTNCDLKMVGEEFSKKPLAMAVQRGSPLKEKFNAEILKLLDGRKLERYKEKWWTKNKNVVKCPKMEDQTEGISIENIGGVFMVILVGIISACFTLCFEYCYYKNINKAANTKSVSQQVANINQPAQSD